MVDGCLEQPVLDSEMHYIDFEVIDADLARLTPPKLT